MFANNSLSDSQNLIQITQLLYSENPNEKELTLAFDKLLSQESSALKILLNYLLESLATLLNTEPQRPLSVRAIIYCYRKLLQKSKAEEKQEYIEIIIKNKVIDVT